MTENWYLVLELEFDPDPVTDETVIEQRIEEKRKFWSSKANDFNHGPEYRKYSQMLKDIKKDMIGVSNIRQELINDAKKKIYDPIDKILKQVQKDLEIPGDTVEKISKKKKVDKEIIKRRATALGIKIRSSQGGEVSLLYDKYYKNKPKNADKFNGMKQMLKSFNADDIYQFLYMGTSIKNASRQPCEVLRQRAKEKKTKEFYKNDSISGTGSKICGQCDEIFRDAASKNTYDKYMEYIKCKEILDEVKEIYELRDEITPEAYCIYIGNLSECLKNKMLAEEVFAEFCKMEKIHSPAQENTSVINNPNIKICRCGCMNDISDGRKVCMNCGLELEIKCPECGTVNDACVNVCKKCGFKFENIDKAVALCELASSAIDNMDFTIAHAHLDDAEMYWPKNNEVRKLKQKLDEKEKRVGSIISEMKEACNNKNYYAARKFYSSIQKYAPEYKDIFIEEEIQSHIDDAERYKEKAKTAKTETEIFEACSKAHEACRDCVGVHEIIAKYPPCMPKDLNVAVDTINKVNFLSWTKSESDGELFYLVVRKEGAVPVSINDGQLVDRVSMCSITDKKILAGAQYYYAVFTERAGVCSKALATKEPVMNLFEISGVTVVPGDSSLQFSWDKIAENASVEIEKNVNGIKTKLNCNNKSNFIDKNLENDVEYTYRIYLVYFIGMKKIVTKGVHISETPTKPPVPIEKLSVRLLQNDEFLLEWDNPENSNIQFYFSEKRPEYYSGDIIPLSVFERSMKSLMVQKKTNSSGVFYYTGEEIIYVVPVIAKSDFVVIGTAERVSRSGNVRVKNANLVNGKIFIGIDAPKDASGFVVLYRTDKFPEDISDVITVRKYIPLKQYEYDGGLLIDANESQNYYFSIFAEFKADGEKDYSSGTEYLFANISKEIITYEVSVNKKLFGKRNLELTFESEKRQDILPAIDVMYSIGSVPMFKKLANLFCQIDEQETDGNVKVTIPIKKNIPKETYIKAFLRDEALQERYKLKLKWKSELRIS